MYKRQVLLRDIAVVGLCALVIHQIYRPEKDLVRFGGEIDDPAGGVFDRAPDDPPNWLPDWLRPDRDRMRLIGPVEEKPSVTLDA